MSTLNFSSLTIQDLPECTALFVSVFEKEPWFDKWPSQQMAQDYLQDIMSSSGFIGAKCTINGRIVACAFGNVIRWWSGNQLYLHEYFVATDLQRQAIGKSMLLWYKQLLTKCEVGTITLLTRPDTTAGRFYLSNEFKIVDDFKLLFCKF